VHSKECVFALLKSDVSGVYMALLFSMVCRGERPLRFCTTPETGLILCSAGSLYSYTTNICNTLVQKGDRPGN